MCPNLLWVLQVVSATGLPLAHRLLDGKGYWVHARVCSAQGQLRGVRCRTLPRRGTDQPQWNTMRDLKVDPLPGAFTVTPYVGEAYVSTGATDEGARSENPPCAQPLGCHHLPQRSSTVSLSDGVLTHHRGHGGVGGE